AEHAATGTAKNLAQAVMSTPDVACYGDSDGTIHVPHEKENFDAPEVASIGRATRTSRSRERVRTSHPYYGVRSSFPAQPKKIFFREGTPELASPCRLFGRRTQTALAAEGGILKQSWSCLMQAPTLFALSCATDAAAQGRTRRYDFWPNE